MQARLDTNYGAIILELDEKNTSKTTANFVKYAKAGFYDGTIFHRVIDGFMIQGGGFESDMVKKPTSAPIQNEADKASSNVRGTVAMARTSNPHSASAQFFINVADNAFLDFKSKQDEEWGYCVFGKVIEGMNVVDQIKQAETSSRRGYADVPKKDVLIEKVVIIQS